MSTPLTYTIEQAAERLGPVCSVDWLKKHMREIPHRKSGKGTGRAGRVGFTDSDLEAILDRLKIEPEGAPSGDATSDRVTRRSA